MTNAMMILALAALLSLSAGCGEAPTCENVANHMIGLMDKDMDRMLKDVPPELRAVSEQALRAELTVEKLTTKCLAEMPEDEIMKCAMTATTTEEVAKCEKV